MLLKQRSKVNYEMVLSKNFVDTKKKTDRHQQRKKNKLKHGQ